MPIQFVKSNKMGFTNNKTNKTFNMKILINENCIPSHKSIENSIKSSTFFKKCLQNKNMLNFFLFSLIFIIFI